MGEPCGSQLNDDELYARYLDGEMEAGDALMLRYSGLLTGYLYSFLKDPLDAEDLMIDCFTVILVDRPRIKEGCFRPYLFQVAHHKACSFRRRKQFRDEFFLPEDEEELRNRPEDPDAKGVHPETEILEGERNTRLRKCLNHIAPQYREALWLIYGMQFKYEEAAAIMGCGRKRINNLLVNGKAALRSELEKEGITYDDI